MATPLYHDDKKSFEESKVEDISKEGPALPVLENDNAQDPVDLGAVSKFADLTANQCISKFRRLYALGLCCSLGGLYVGFANTIPGNIIANPGFINQFGTVIDPHTGGKALDAVHVAAWGGSVWATQVVFQALSPITADKFGVKINLYILTISMLIAIILEIIAKEWKVYLAAKLMAGVASAYLGPGLVAYMTEIAMPNMRGAMVVPFAFMYAFGSFLGALALQIIKMTAPFAYRKAFYSQFAIFGLWLIPCIILPETPIFYCKQGKHDKAKKSLRFLVGNVEGYDLEHEYTVIQREVHESRETLKAQGVSGWHSLLKWKNFRRTVISVLPIAMQGLAGAALTFGYSAYFFQLSGFSDPFLGSVALYVVLIVGVILAVFLIDRAGRRRLVLIGATICILCDFAIGGLAFAPVTGPAPKAIVALVCVWMAGYSISLQSVGWVYLGEIASVSLRAKSIGVASVFQSSINLGLSYLVPIMLSPQKLGWGAKIGFFFGGISVFWIALIYLFCPETKGRTSNEIDELFDNQVPAWRSASYFKQKDARAALQTTGEME